jgi:hypothetical protein
VFRDLLVAVALDGGHSAETASGWQVSCRAARQVLEHLPVVPHVSLAQFIGPAGSATAETLGLTERVYLGNIASPCLCTW